MKIVKQSMVCLVLGFVLLVSSASVVCAGEGGPPVGFKYAPPAYQGILTLSYDNGNVYVNGDVYQMGGKSACVGYFREYYQPYMFDKEFKDLNSGDLQGFVIPNSGVDVIFDCLGDGAPVQVIGVGKFYWSGDAEFQANFVIMGLK